MLSKLIKPEILQVESTNDCFLNCRPCMRKHLERPVGYIDFEEFRKLPLSSFKEVCLHGWGEPLLHPDIFKLVEYVKGLNVKASMGTNGFMVDRCIEEIFSSKLDEISFGIYTFDGREKALNNLELLLSEKKERKSEKPAIFVDITVFRDNYLEIPELVRTFTGMGVDGIVLHRLFNVYKVDPDVEYIGRKEEKELFKKVKKIGGKKVYLPARHLKPCRIALYTMFVTWECKQCSCVYLSEEYLGDARTDYETMLRRHVKFVSGMRKHEICKKCFW